MHMIYNVLVHLTCGQKEDPLSLFENISKLGRKRRRKNEIREKLKKRLNIGMNFQKLLDNCMNMETDFNVSMG
jgi:hypothetical protein